MPQAIPFKLLIPGTLREGGSHVGVFARMFLRARRHRQHLPRPTHQITYEEWEQSSFTPNTYANIAHSGPLSALTTSRQWYTSSAT